MILDCYDLFSDEFMAKEIERKFLIVGNGWRKLAPGVHYRQGYLNSAKERTVRVRTVANQAFLTVKGPTVGVTRAEFEYSIPFKDAVAMLQLAEPSVIDKTRYRIPIDNFVWEVDEFHGANEGLVVAEIELPAEDTVFEKPQWVGKEVSGDPRYYNSMLARHPYRSWQER